VFQPRTDWNKRRWWYGTPNWAKSAEISGVGSVVGFASSGGCECQ